MRGLLYDFEEQDIVLTSTGGFQTANIDSQNCALIALSQVCRINYPEVGTRLMSLLFNRKRRNTAAHIAAARRQVIADGGTDVSITIDDNEQLYFEATYVD